MFNSATSTSRRQTRINELRHQIRYAGSRVEREHLRVQLDFWRRLPTEDIPQ